MYCEFLKNENGNTLKNSAIIRWGDCNQFYTLQSYNDIIAEYNADMKRLTVAPRAFTMSPTTEKILNAFLRQYLHFTADKINVIKQTTKKEYYILNSNGLALTIRRGKIQ